MKKPTLYIVQGFIGAGKTTFSKKLANSTGAIHLNADKLVTELFDKDTYMENWNQCFDMAVNLLWNKTEECLKCGKDVIADVGFWYKKDRNHAREIARKCGANCLLYYLNVPDNILKERIIADRPPQWAQIHLQNFDKNKKLFEPPEPDENAITIKNF